MPRDRIRSLRWLPLILLGCPHRFPAPETLVGRQWLGSVRVTTPCAYGNYAGPHLNLCLYAVEQTDGWLQFNVDWDAGALRSDCAYFSFGGGYYDGRLRLVHNDEPHNQLHLRFQGDTLVGFLQVHPYCEPWPVELIRTR